MTDNNCFGECAGWILDLPRQEYPDFSQCDGHGEQVQAFAKWLRPFGCSCLEVKWNFEKGCQFESYFPDALYLLRVEVIGDCNHMVVGQGNRIVYDPMDTTSPHDLPGKPIYVPISMLFVVPRPYRGLSQVTKATGGLRSASCCPKPSAGSEVGSEQDL